jgi:UTP--glucose-1-phosphate uridylyltransferase
VLKNKGDKEKLDIVENVSRMADIFYVRQKEQLGLADAIRTAKSHIDGENFAVLLGDVIVESEIPCTKQLAEVMEKHDASVTGVEEVKKEEIHKFGIIKGKKIDAKTLEIEDFIEKPEPEKAPSNLAAMGRYTFTPEIFDAINSTKQVKGEYLLPDATLKLAKNKKALAHLINGKVYSVGDKMEFLKATVELSLKRNDLKDFREMLQNIVKR